MSEDEADTTTEDEKILLGKNHVFNMNPKNL